MSAAWLLAAALAAADPGSIRVEGRVIAAFSARPLKGASVSAGEVAGVTDADGHFVLEGVARGALLEASADGHLPASRRLDGPASDLVLYLLERDRFQESVEVRGDPAAATDSETIPVRPREVQAVAGGADNVFRVVQLLPGVAGTDEFGSRLAVRGGTPDQNLTIMDGVEIHNPYRLFGLTSAFNPEIVQGFELTAGAFEARYGDRLSSLLVVRNRYGTDTRDFGGSAAVSVTDANVVLEGRLPKGAPGSWLLTGRRTYYDLVAERFVDDDLPSFGDLQGKLHWQPRPGQRLSLLGLLSRETTDAAFDGDLPGEAAALLTGTRNDLAALTFQSDLSSRALSRTTVAAYRNVETLDVDASLRNDSRRSNAPDDDSAHELAEVVFRRELGVTDYSLRQEFTWQRNDRHLFEAGLELHRLETDVAWRISGDRNPGEANGSSVRGGTGLPADLDSALSSTRWGAFVQDRVQMMERFVLEPGLRLEGSSVNGRALLQPRLAASLRIGDATRLRGGFGLHAQSPGYEKLIQSDYFIDLSSVSQIEIPSERSTQLVLGVERELGGGLTARVEGWWKRFDDVLVGRLETEAERQARVAGYDFPAELASSVPLAPQITSFPSSDARGRSYGVDLYLARPAAAGGRLSGWLTYTWGKAVREAYARTYPFEYDRRHAASAVLQWRAKRWLDVGATLRAASGFPRTPVVGLRVAAVEDATDADGDGDRAELVPALDPTGLLVWETDLGSVANLNTGSLPLFARLDLRLNFKPRGDAGRLSLYLDFINVTNRDNAGQIEARLEYDPASDRPRIVEERAAALPFLPSFGVRWRF